MKKNGFVFLETLVVVCVLSLTLLLLFGTYSYILRKSRERNVFDTTEMIYKTYYTKDILTHEYGNIETYIEYINIRNCTGKTGGEKDEKQHDDREGSYN